jgi:hypothetical protein
MDLLSLSGVNGKRSCPVWHIAVASLDLELNDRWRWFWRNWWNEDWQRKPKYSEKTCPSPTLSTTNPTWLDPVLNPGRRGGKPATNRLSYGAALLRPLTSGLDHWPSEQNECIYESNWARVFPFLHLMTKQDPTFEISCSLNILETMDDFKYNNVVMKNRPLSQTFTG